MMKPVLPGVGPEKQLALRASALGFRRRSNGSLVRNVSNPGVALTRARPDNSPLVKSVRVVKSLDCQPAAAAPLQRIRFVVVLTLAYLQPPGGGTCAGRFHDERERGVEEVAFVVVPDERVLGRRPLQLRKHLG